MLGVTGCVAIIKHAGNVNNTLKFGAARNLGTCGQLDLRDHGRASPYMLTEACHGINRSDGPAVTLARRGARARIEA